VFKKIQYLAFTVGLFLLICGGLFGQTPQELRVGTPISATLRAGDEQWFSVRPSGTGILTVETTGSTDTYLEAYDASRNLLEEDDDSGEGNNARLEILTGAGSAYLFKVRGYDKSESGPYTIRAKFEALPNPQELRFGNPVSGRLREGERQWFSVRPTGAGIVVVETTGSTDTYLDAYDGSLKHIAGDDDSGEDGNARLEIFVEAGQTYRFRLRCYSDDESGPFSIRAGFESVPPDTERNTERSRSVSLKLWEPVPVFIRSPGESRWYRCEITNAESLIIAETSGSLDTLLAIYDDRGNLIEEDDDSGEGNNARLLVKRGRGTVYIEVKAYSGMGRTTLHTEIWRRN